MKLITSLSILLIFFLSCTNPNEVKYKGSIIELDFNNVKEIDPDLWIKFDDYLFEHVELMDEGNKTEFPLPIHYVVIDTTNPNRDFTAPLNVKNVGLHVARNLRKVNRLVNDQESKFVIKEPQTLAALGILKIGKTDLSSFTVTTPKNYPIKVTILED